MNKKHVLDLLAMQASLIQTALLAHMKGEHLSETDLVGLCVHGYEFLVTEQGHEFDPVMGASTLRHVKNVNEQLARDPNEYEKEVQEEYVRLAAEKAEKEETPEAIAKKLGEIFGIDPKALMS
jgi:hypothetical protein